MLEFVFFYFFFRQTCKYSSLSPSILRIVAQDCAIFRTIPLIIAKCCEVVAQYCMRNVAQLSRISIALDIAQHYDHLLRIIAEFCVTTFRAPSNSHKFSDVATRTCRCGKINVVTPWWNPRFDAGNEGVYPCFIMLLLASDGSVFLSRRCTRDMISATCARASFVICGLLVM